MTDSKTGNPQTEDGYTRLANELFEALARIRIPGRARQVLDAILRRTYGYQKKSDLISLSQLSKATGLSTTHCARAKRVLLGMRIISTKNGRGGIASLSLNKHYNEWEPVPKMVGTTKNGTIAVPKMVLKPVPKMVDTKERKKLLKKEDTRHSRAVDYWHTRYLAEIGFKYDYSGRDFKHIKQLLKVFTDEQYQALVDYILTTDDSWVADGRRTLGILYAMRNQIVQRLKNPKPNVSDRTQRTIAGMQAYLNRRKAEDERGRQEQIGSDPV